MTLLLSSTLKTPRKLNRLQNNMHQCSVKDHVQSERISKHNAIHVSMKDQVKGIEENEVKTFWEICYVINLMLHKLYFVSTAQLYNSTTVSNLCKLYPSRLLFMDSLSYSYLLYGKRSGRNVDLRKINLIRREKIEFCY